MPPAADNQHMAITKKAKPHAESWREAIRVHLSKVPEVDAVFVSVEDKTIHVYSVIEQFHKTNYKRLISRESRIEKAFPELSFEFHAWPHQGREPREAGPPNCELVYRG